MLLWLFVSVCPPSVGPFSLCLIHFPFYHKMADDQDHINKVFAQAQDPHTVSVKEAGGEHCESRDANTLGQA